MSRIAFAVVMLSGAVAAAEPSTKVFPLTGQRVPKAKKDLPELLTRTVAKSLGATVAGMSIEDTADLVSCKMSQTPCLKEVARNAGAQRIVYGIVAMRAEGGVNVRLSTFDKDSQDERTYVLTGDTNEALAAQLARNLGKGDDDEPVEVVVKPRRPPAPPVVVPPDPVPAPVPPIDEEEPASSGGVTTGTWAMIIGGGATALVGGGLFISGNQLKKQAGTLPAETRADFDTLLKFERAASLRMNIGAGLAIAGTAVAVIGVVRAVSQKGTRKESPTLSVAPEQGGASLFYTRSWR